MNDSGQPVCDLGDCLFEPDQKLPDKYGIVAAAAFVNDRSGRVPVRLLNTGGNTKLYRGKTLGRVSNAMDYNHLNVLQQSQSSSHDKQNVAQDQFDWTQSSLTPTERTSLQRLLDEYSDLFSTGPGDIGRTTVTTHSISTGSSQPIRRRPYRQPFHVRQEVERHVQNMLDSDVIKPSSSPWSSPIIMVPKKDGTFRFCVDFRHLNEVTIKDAFPLPRVDETLESLGGARYFSTLDLASGYWQVELDPESQPKTAFTTRSGHYEFQVMPFGLCNAPATFQRLMEMVLRGLNWDVCLIYLDDIIIFSATFQDHLSRLRQVFDRLRQAGLKFSPKKCHFAQQQVEYLGHIVSKHGIAVDPSKVSKVRDWPTPRSVKEVRTFLGVASYYRRFVPEFARIAGPLNQLTRKGVQFTWSPEAENAFCHLKQHLCQTPIMAYPNFEKTFTLKTDASDTALGAVLCQIDDEIERPVAYASRSLSSSESNYSATEKETLAVV